ncbi:MAG: SoxR reducing system RseC family protein [Desulfobacterales bacterium]|nr:SoxR reducing system RseC family protein [Desulfobacterales bacterium]
MITENGIVTKANQSIAWIKTTRSGACESCSSKGSCEIENSQKEMIVSVKNTLKVDKGDHVVIGLETKPMLFLTFLLYVFPIILLIIGALIGNSLAPSLQMDPSFVSMISGFLFFGLSFYIIRKKNNSLSKKAEYKPFLVRKKPQIIPADCTIL